MLISCFSCSENRIKKEKPIKIKSEFKDKDVQCFKVDGNSSIEGIAKFKSKDEGIRYGKEFRIELNPFTPDPEGCHETRKTMCNDKGEFEFKNLPEGNYYVIAFILWDKTGEGIMQDIQLSDNEIKTIEMINF